MRAPLPRERVRSSAQLGRRADLANDWSPTLCRPSAYALASRLMASWMEARVTKVARVSARFSQHDLAAALNQAEDGRLVRRRRAASRRALQPAPAPEPPLLATAAGWPLWPATT